MPSSATTEPSADVLAIVRQWVEMRLMYGSLSPIVRHELETMLRIIRDECASREVRLP
jgi:hypothetical protein